MKSVEELRATLQDRGLSKVWLPAEQLGGWAVAQLAEDLSGIDWDIYDRQRKALLHPSDSCLPSIFPPELVPASCRTDAPGYREALEAGEWALRGNTIAILTVAGGQASRLGFDGPKGAYPIGQISGSSLFQILAGQIHRLRERYSCDLPWIIQTGPGNHQETITFFERRSFFGLGSGTVSFVCQGSLPALHPKGQLLLATPSRLFQNPDGHGGVYRALKRSGLINDLRGRGVHTLFYCQVDNPLAWLGDPVFLGHHLLQEARMSVKVVEKIEPSEKVGLVVSDGERNLCVEYSDLDEETQSQRAEDGGLTYRAGNIAIHAFELDFLEEMAEANLPLHLAKKQIRGLAPDGVGTTMLEGVKFETFVFDALPMARRSMVQYADRFQEFAPVKNRSGVDSIATSKTALSARAREWIASVDGFEIDTDLETTMEIAPGLCLGPLDLQRQEASLRWAISDRLLEKFNSPGSKA
ncbi:MAG: UTP--glucose-1-phosphate uridylyltransferase [Planctomycetota bacterium]|jgi:UDP-N-acetylglucosamine/UDP-N-acetylgalactosamine diphosphorylase